MPDSLRYRRLLGGKGLVSRGGMQQLEWPVLAPGWRQGRTGQSEFRRVAPRVRPRGAPAPTSFCSFHTGAITPWSVSRASKSQDVAADCYWPLGARNSYGPSLEPDLRTTALGLLGLGGL